MTRPILILTNERDFAADDVIRRLQPSGIGVTRLNIESARTSAVRAWSPWSEMLDDELSTLVWWRQFELPELAEDLSAADDILVARSQWRTWLSTLARPHDIWVNDLWNARRAENKIEQLRVARSVGFRLPRTIVTNDPEVAAEFRRQHRGAIVKTIASAYFELSDRSFVFTEMLDDRLLQDSALWWDVPVLVQESLVEATDARIISFGTECFAACSRSKGSDWRKTPFDPELWQPWQPPAALARMCKQYRSRMGLEYAAFDFMVDDDGPLFLEANQAGEWLFLDRSVDLGVGDAFTDHLVRLSRRSP